MSIDRRDIFAPASYITATGLVLCLLGAVRLNQPLGLLLIVIGRSMDLIDGPVARATRPTRFGSVFDASADKVALAAILIACYFYQLAPIAALVYIVIHNSINAIAAVIAQHKKNNPNTAISGKLAMFGENIALLLFIMASVGGLFINSTVPGIIALLISVPFGVVASNSYIKAALSKPHAYDN